MSCVLINKLLAINVLTIAVLLASRRLEMLLRERDEKKHDQLNQTERLDSPCTPSYSG